MLAFILGILLTAIFIYLFHNYFIIEHKVLIKGKTPNKVITYSKRSDTTALQRIQFDIEALVKQDSMRGASFGFCLMTADSGKVMYQYNADEILVPASIQKVITTGIALNKVGAGFSYSTRLQYDGTIDKTKKLLIGNIYIKGSGDPSLGASTFSSTNPAIILKKWYNAIKDLGIDSIRGAIVGDEELFETDMIPPSWAWEDMQGDYCAGASGLSFMENMYTMNISSKNGKPFVSTNPQLPYLKLRNQLIINNALSKNIVFVTGSPYMNERFLRGVVKDNITEYKVQSMIPDPAYSCAYTLFNLLKQKGIKVRDSANTVRMLKLENKYKRIERKERITILTTNSLSLLELINYTNHWSQNFYAESFLKLIAVKSGYWGSTVDGVKAEYEFLKKNKINTQGLYLNDGSGLSRFNGVSAKKMCELLMLFSKDTTTYKLLASTFPIGDPASAYSKLLLGTKAIGRVKAKSGFMGRVRSYTGYVKNNHGKLLVFTIISNNHDFHSYTLKTKIEKLLVLMCEVE